MPDPEEKTPPRARRSSTPPHGPPRGYNVLLLTVDQERFFDRYPFPVPGRERLLRESTSFVRHMANTNVCTASRSVLYTGLHMPQTGMFDNVGLPWMRRSLDPSLGTLGSMLASAGYRCAYYGKWHLSWTMDRGHPSGPAEIPLAEFHDELRRYGFDDYYGFGDYINRSFGGYQYDPLTTGFAVSWLRGKGLTLAKEGTPWFLAVNLVNPHDVMFVLTDEPGREEQWHGPVFDGSGISNDPTPPPANEIYRATWDTVPLPSSRHQPLTDAGRPPAHLEYRDAHGALVGAIPNEDWRWRKLQDYYFNCIRDCDRQVELLLQELDVLGLRDKTIIVFTSDHGELGGAHGLHGKGTTAYAEQIHVPLLVSHPAYPGGRRCEALTCHLDLAPTIVALTGLPAEKQAQILGARKGKDLTPLLAAPERAGVHAARDAVLYCYGMILYTDARYTSGIKTIASRKDLTGEQMVRAMQEIHPDLSKRSAIRCLIDGEYKLARYFALTDHHTPRTLAELRAKNDVELFDLRADPMEMHNLAGAPKNAAILEAMSAKLNAWIEQEIGPDDGSHLQLHEMGSWGSEGPIPE